MDAAEPDPYKPASSRRRRLILQAATILALAWVSYGSHEVLVWIGMPSQMAWVYPGIVDLAVLYVTPFAADGSLPDDGEWKMRTHASRTRVMIWVSVAAFNVLHMILLVQSHMAGLSGALRWVAYSVSVVAGIAPVIFYGRAYHLETMSASWERAEATRRAEQARQAATERAEQAARQEQERAEREAEQEREQAAQEAAAKAEADRLAAQAELTRARAQARAQRESARASTRRPREDSTPKPRAETPAETGNPQLDELVASIDPGMKKADQVKTLLAKAWDREIDLSGTEAARRLGCDTAYGRSMANDLKKTGIRPPSELALSSAAT